jgi:glycerate 2-kinase
VISNTVLVAPDAFKGTLSASQVAKAIGSGLRAAGRQTDLLPVADGGEASAEILIDALGGRFESAVVSDPLGRSVSARYGLLNDGDTAIVEVAEASGLTRLAEDERDAMRASSKGTGELILAAVAAGAKTVLVGAGSSASTDGGAGAIGAINSGGGLGEANLIVLCDVRSPFEEAAARYGPQKGADPAAVASLRKRLDALARRLPRDPRGQAMTGAAGGLSGGLWAAFAARLTAGSPYLLDRLGFDRRMRMARAVIVGEGTLDRSTLQGKAPFEIATRARQAGVPAYAIVGHNALDRFDARVLDLQLILEASDERQLTSAAKKLARSI